MSANNEIELKPCPFCGGTDIVQFETDFGRSDDPYSSVVECRNCHAMIVAEDDEVGDDDDRAAFAEQKWNRRATDAN